MSIRVHSAFGKGLAGNAKDFGVASDDFLVYPALRFSDGSAIPLAGDDLEFPTAFMREEGIIRPSNRSRLECWSQRQDCALRREGK
jgi:hypothetical protein